MKVLLSFLFALVPSLSWACQSPIISRVPEPGMWALVGVAAAAVAVAHFIGRK